MEHEKTHEELDEKEIIDLCSESRTTTSEFSEGEESMKQENCTCRRAKQSQGWRVKIGLKRSSRRSGNQSSDDVLG